MRIPKYRKHSTRDVAIVEFKGERRTLPGRYNSEESKSAYRRFLRDEGLADPISLSATEKPTVALVVAAYLDFAEGYYGEQRGSEYHKMKVVGTPLTLKYGNLLAEEFGPKKLKLFRESLIEEGHGRVHVNANTGRVKRMFCWAASEELIPGTVYHALLSVKGLEKFRTKAPEPKKRMPVPKADVDAVLAELSPLISDMLCLQWLTGARSDSICQAKPEQFDRSQSPWVWRPRHKQEQAGGELVIPIGPQAQKILLPYLSRDHKAYLFQPRTQRNNPRYGQRYSSQSYRQAIHRALDRVNKSRAEKKLPLIPRWVPHQVRHAIATLVRAKYGLEASQAVLGHETIDATQLYAERNQQLAAKIAKEIG